jgi:hypothetical protein
VFFTDDLPNGPYATMPTKPAFEVYLSRSTQAEGKLFASDIAQLVEAFTTSQLASQAAQMPSYVKMTFDFKVGCTGVHQGLH